MPPSRPCDILDAPIHSGTVCALWMPWGAATETEIMRRGLILAAALTALSALSALSATGARADEWCGYASHEDAVIECGYTTADQCESAVGKGGMCFVDPDLALDTRRSMTLWSGIAVLRT